LFHYCFRRVWIYSATWKILERLEFGVITGAVSPWLTRVGQCGLAEFASESIIDVDSGRRFKSPGTGGNLNREDTGVWAGLFLEFVRVFILQWGWYRGFHW
jgi:hypothetical protein